MRAGHVDAAAAARGRGRAAAAARGPRYNGRRRCPRTQAAAAAAPERPAAARRRAGGFFFIWSTKMSNEAVLSTFDFPQPPLFL